MASTSTPDDAPFFTPEDVDLIRKSIMPGASDIEFQTNMRVASLLRLNPLLGQIYFVKRTSRNPSTGAYEERWAYQTSVHGFRLIAQRTGEWEGESEAVWERDPKTGTPLSCTIEVYRRGFKRPFIGRVKYSEFVQTTRDGKVTKMWAEKPEVMLEKCAAVAAYRKGFPRELGSLEEPAEMGRAGALPEVAQVGASVGFGGPAKASAHDEVTGEVVAPEPAAPPQLEMGALAQAFLGELLSVNMDDKAAKKELTARMSAAIDGGRLAEHEAEHLRLAHAQRTKAWRDGAVKGGATP